MHSKHSIWDEFEDITRFTDIDIATIRNEMHQIWITVDSG